VEDTNMTWRKSTYSNGGADACLESATDSGVVLVRDTTDRDGTMLVFSPSVWRAFTRTVTTESRLRQRH